MKRNNDLKSSLFIGRWQPFHKGHQKMIETVLKNGKPVVIGIRDTELSTSNPYSTSERWTMIQTALNKYAGMVKIVVIPDIDEICYGRDVGYGIRRIDLPQKIENISGTKIRQQSNEKNIVIWLTGQSGAGKSTLANELSIKLRSVVLDGDEMRDSISSDLGFSRKDRVTHNLRVAKLANVLAKKTPVIVSVIAPFKSTRKLINELIAPIWIYVKRNLPERRDHPYEPPENPDIIVNSDTQSTEDQVKAVLNLLKDRQTRI